MRPIRSLIEMRTVRPKLLAPVLAVALTFVTASCSGSGSSSNAASISPDPTVAPAKRQSAPLGNVELPPLEFAAVDDSGAVSADVTSEALFDFDSAELKPAVSAIVEQISQRLSGQSSWVRIDGYTDGKGSEAYNLELSQRRADALAAEITALGTAEDVQSCGRGEEGTDGESEDPSARRVVVTISPSPFPEVCG